MVEPREKTKTRTPRRKTVKGTVVSDKMTETIVVTVSRKKAHPLYGKVVKSSKKYMAHDPREEAGIGDFVMLEETRPLSKRKHWRLLKIIEKAR